MFLSSLKKTECGSGPSLLSFWCSLHHDPDVDSAFEITLAQSKVQKEEISLTITLSFVNHTFFICAAERFCLCARKQCMFKLLTGMYWKIIQGMTCSGFTVGCVTLESKIPLKAILSEVLILLLSLCREMMLFAAKSYMSYVSLYWKCSCWLCFSLIGGIGQRIDEFCQRAPKVKKDSWYCQFC